MIHKKVPMSINYIMSYAYDYVSTGISRKVCIRLLTQVTERGRRERDKNLHVYKIVS